MQLKGGGAILLVLLLSCAIGYLSSRNSSPLRIWPFSFIVLRIVSNIHAVPHSLFDMVGELVVRTSLYALGFVSLDSVPALETIDEFIVGCFLFIGVSLGD